MQRKWLIFIILCGSDRDPAVFLLKTSCLTREGEGERERDTNKIEQMMLFTIAKRNTKSDKPPEIVLALIAEKHPVLALPCNFPLCHASNYYS